MLFVCVWAEPLDYTRRSQKRYPSGLPEREKQYALYAEEFRHWATHSFVHLSSCHIISDITLTETVWDLHWSRARTSLSSTSLNRCWHCILYWHRGILSLIGIRLHCIFPMPSTRAKQSRGLAWLEHILKKTSDNWERISGGMLTEDSSFEKQ